MPTELQEIQQFYRSHDIPLSTEWLQCCIEWCKDGNLPPNYTIKDMQKMVYEQWLILDLQDVEVASLPRNLSNEKRFCLTGCYFLQMMQVVDISKPKLWQLQRIRNNVAKNTEAEKDFGKRVLQLTLTDGVQKVEAMEYQPIQCFNINLPPGIKIKITGPIMVRNGRLMLKEENVKLLGGAVDDIRVQFAAENVLARALRLEENPNPYPIDENALEVSEENTTAQINQTANTQNFNALNQNRNQNPNHQVQPRNIPSNNQNMSGTNQNISRTQTTTNRQNINQEIPPEFQVDDDLLRELEADFEENCVRSIPLFRANTRSNANDRSRPLCRSPDLFEEMEVDDELLNEHLDQIDVDHMPSNSRSTVNSGISPGNNRNVRKRLNSGEPSWGSAGNIQIFRGPKNERVKKNQEVVQDLEISSSSVFQSKPPNKDNVIALDDSFDDIDIDSHLDNIDKEMANLPSSTQRRDDLKNTVRSPELKSRKIRLNSLKNVGSTTSKKPLGGSTNLTQGTLNFEVSKRHGLNVPSSGTLNLQEAKDDNPLSIFKKQPQKSTVCRLPASSDVPKLSLNPPKKSLDNSRPKGNTNHFPCSSNTSNLSETFSNVESKLPFTATMSSALPHNSETSLTSPPSFSKILSIEKLKKILPTVGKGKFKIKGQFRGVAEKLTYSNVYHFVIVVGDSTGDLTVQMHSDLVTSIVETNSDNLKKMKLLALQGDQDVKVQILKVLQTLHRRCLELDNVLEIQVARGEKYPVVINII